MKISDAVTGFWLTKRLNMSKATQAKYDHVYRRMVEVLGDKDIEQVTSADIRRFLAALQTQHDGTERKQLSKRTLHDYWACLSSFWTWAEQELEIAHIIRGKVKAPEYKESPIDPFTNDEVRRIVEACAETADKRSRKTAVRDKAIVLTLLDSGLRAAELCDLTIEDYDSGRGRLHVKHGKGDKERFVTIGQRTQKMLWRYLASRSGAKPTEPLFISGSGRKLDKTNLTHLLIRIGERGNVQSAHAHRFRYTFAIEFLRNGGNVFVLKELLGHEKLEQTMRYVKFVESDISESAKHSPTDNWRL